jgi:putative SbcD/Mre11-related phosphoesterase
MVSGIIKFVYGEPAVFYDTTLALADLHVGIEEELAAKGFRAGAANTMLAQRLECLAENQMPTRVVIVGDVKHDIAGASWNGAQALKGMVDLLALRARVVIVPGNHDAGLGSLGLKAEIAGSSGVGLDGVWFAHGHANVPEEAFESDYLFIGHAHPCIEVAGPAGDRLVERVWVQAEADKEKLLSEHPGANEDIKLVLMPAFNPLSGGIPLNRGPRALAMGPVLRSGMFKLGEGQIFLLDGVGLGTVSSHAGSPR